MEEKEKTYTINLTEKEKEYLINLLQNQDSGKAEFINVSIGTKLIMSTDSCLSSTINPADMLEVMKSMYAIPKNVILDVKEVPDNMTREDVIDIFKEIGVLLIQSRGDTKPVNSRII